MDCTAQLIINIAQHFKTGRGLATQAWEALKLSEMGQLTNESIEIIAANTGQKADAVRAALQEGIKTSLADEEAMLQNAADKGYVKTTAGTLETSQHVRDLVDAYVAQAEDDMNLVNTVMLQSTQNRYQMAIQQVVNAEEAAQIEALTGAKNAAELAAQMGKVQRTINAATGSTLLGNEARTKALRGAIATLANQGITGFIDAGGHHWTPEAYINMDIRTTVGNVARQAQKTRAAEYGVDTFQVSRHAAARPLCAPYQGWICSWSGGGYTVEDLYGNQYTVHNINETSYGQPAGLFGINCGHNPLTFVPGYSVPRAQELTPEEEQENALQYAQSQQQRYLEREVRHAKTEALAYDAAGDKEGFVLASQKVKQTQADYAAFCKQTGRTPRTDRLQVYGYNRSVSGKATAATRGYKPQATPVKAVKPAPIIKPDGQPAPALVQVATRAEANAALVDTVGFVQVESNFKKVTEQLAIDNTNQLLKLEHKFGCIHQSQGTIGAVNSGRAQAYVSSQYTNPTLQNLSLCPRSYAQTVEAFVDAEKRAMAQKWAMPFADEYTTTYAATHEYGHILQNVLVRRAYEADGWTPENARSFYNMGAKTKNARVRWYLNHEKQVQDKCFNDIMEIAKQRNPEFSLAENISGYGKSNKAEFFAEVFANSQCGAPNELGEAMNIWLEREGLIVNAD